MALPNPFALFSPDKSPPSSSELKSQYYKLQAQWGDSLGDQKEGKSFLQTLEREDIKEIVDNFVFSSPTTITLLWDVQDYLHFGFKHYLVIGEPGSGKEAIACSIAKIQNRRLIPVNCATLVDSLADALLFGIAPKSGIVGAPAKGTKGFIGEASGQVLFLDEFFDAPPIVFPKLLRLLQAPRTYYQVGGSTEIPLHDDTIIIAASNRHPTLCSLDDGIADGSVRSDLIDRFQVRLAVPPLRDRKQEIGDIANNLISRLPGKKYFHGLDESTVQSLRFANYDWPGNVRELERFLAAQARLQRHVPSLDGRLRIPQQAIDSLGRERNRNRPSEQLPEQSISGGALTAWHTEGLRSIRLRELLSFLNFKKANDGIGKVDTSWVSKVLSSEISVPNISQKLKDAVQMNLGELTSLLNELSSASERTIDELVHRSRARTRPKQK